MTAISLALALFACESGDLGQETLDQELTAEGKMPARCDLRPWYADVDGDRRGDGTDVVYSTFCNYPGRTIIRGDCDDTDAEIHRGALEVCDGIDNDCDGLIDGDDTPLYGSIELNYYLDADGDGFGDPSVVLRACTQPPNTVNDGTDCDDGDASINPGAAEVCDEIDNDCDGAIDGLDSNVTETTTYYVDYDGDGFGATRITMEACTTPSGFVEDSSDCNDLDSATNPDAEEVCDEEDNNCDGDTDEGLDATYYEDADGDMFGDPDSTTTACEAPSGYTSDASDCDDTDPQVSPYAVEICDGTDNDCDGNTDGSDAWDVETFYADGDGDGYGDSSVTEEACSASSGYTSDAGDCDDDDGSISPGEAELCDEVDNDCDGDTDESGALDASTWVYDYDGDGYGSDDASFSVDSCDQPSGFVDDLSDCDDGDDTINPDAEDTCGDGVDTNCDGVGGPDDDEDGDGLTWTEEEALGLDDCDASSGVDCTTVDTGNVVIFSTDDASDLCSCTTVVDQLYVNATGTDPIDLSCLATINDKLEIENSDAASVDLSSLTSVGDDLYIHNNGEIQSIDLSALEEVTSDVSIEDNDDLESLELSSLDSIGGQFYLYNNDALETVDISALTTVGSSFYIYHNDAIEDFSAPSLTSLGNELFLYYNTSLQTLSIPALEYAPNQVQVEENYDLETLDLGALKDINSSLYIRHNYTLNSADLGALETVSSSLYMQYNYELASFNLDSLQTVGSELYIYYHSDLESLSMPALTSVGASLTLSYNEALTELSAPSLSSIGGTLILEDNDDLASVDLSSLTCVSDYTIEGHSLSSDDHYDLLVWITSEC